MYSYLIQAFLEVLRERLKGCRDLRSSYSPGHYHSVFAASAHHGWEQGEKKEGKEKLGPYGLKWRCSQLVLSKEEGGEVFRYHLLVSCKGNLSVVGSWDLDVVWETTFLCNMLTVIFSSFPGFLAQGKVFATQQQLLTIESTVIKMTYLYYVPRGTFKVGRLRSSIDQNVTREPVGILPCSQNVQQPEGKVSCFVRWTCRRQSSLSHKPSLWNSYIKADHIKILQSRKPPVLSFFCPGFLRKWDLCRFMSIFSIIWV